MNILNKNGFNLKFWITLIVNFLGILFANFIIRKIAGTNAYIYGTLAFIVSIALLIYDIIFFKDFIKEEWLKYRKNIWKNIFYSIIVVILVGLTISVARPLFSGLLPDPKVTGVVKYDFPITAISGILISIISGISDVIIAFVEEITYRYESMFRFKKYGITPLSIMLIVSSLLFGFSHFYNYNGSFIATIPYGLAGLVLAISYLLTNKFFVPTIAHIIFNSTSLISSIFLLIVYLIK